jgi:hypothetical protein
VYFVVRAAAEARPFRSAPRRPNVLVELSRQGLIIPLQTPNPKADRMTGAPTAIKRTWLPGAK